MISRVEQETASGDAQAAVAPSARQPRARAIPVKYEMVVGGGLVLLILVVALVAPLISPADPNFIQGTSRAAPPISPGFPLGADELGRDILSRLIWGARVSLVTAIVPTAIALAIGCLLGMFAGYLKGAFDSISMRLLDVLLAFPTVLLALGIAAALGPSLTSVIIAMTIVGIPAFARLLRASVLTTSEELYVLAARSVGIPSGRIMAVHILPNVISPVVVYATLQTGRNVILAAGLSFLGLGVQPPEADWGAMLSSGRSILVQAPHVATIPGVAIFLLTLGFNLLGDGLRDALDPRMKA